MNAITIGLTPALTPARAPIALRGSLLRRIPALPRSALRALALLTFGLLPPIPAFAAPFTSAPSTSTLSWVRLDGAESCIAAPELAKEVEIRLGRPVFVPPSGAGLVVEGRAERLNEGDVRWRAVLRLTDATGTSLGDRVVESRAETCEELGRVTAVAIALMIDPVGGEPPPPPPPPPPAPTKPPWHFEIDGSLIGGAGTVPGVAVGGIAVVIVRAPRVIPLLVQGELVPFARAEVSAAEGSAVQADFTRLMGGIQACPLSVVRGPVTLDACLGVDVGVIFLIDSSTPLDATEKVLVQAHAALHLHWNVVGPLVLRAGLHPLVRLREVSFNLPNGAEVYAPPPVAGFADVGLGVRW